MLFHPLKFNAMFLRVCCIGILSMLLIKAGCHEAYPSAAPGDIMQLQISHYKVPCVGDNVQLCFRIENNDGAPEFFYDAIKGFTYEWGYNYTLLVEKKLRQNPPAGASSLTYTLKKVLRKEKAASGTTFELPLHLNEQPLVETANDRCTYWGDVAIETGTRSCAELLQAQAAVFRHNNSKPGLVLVALK